MNIKEKLLYLVRYYNDARHCGHTNAILFGMKRNPKAMMLTIDAQGMKQLKHRIPEMDVVTIDELGKLAGLRRPLTIDNHALVLLLSEALEEINRLEGAVLYHGVRIIAPINTAP